MTRERSLLIADVSDNGRGIEPGILGACFSRTFRAATVGRIGLSDRPEDHHEHQGRIRAEKNHPRGAVCNRIAGSIERDTYNRYSASPIGNHFYGLNSHSRR